jgi:hypothetical protein
MDIINMLENLQKAFQMVANNRGQPDKAARAAIHGWVNEFESVVTSWSPPKKRKFSRIETEEDFIENDFK